MPRYILKTVPELDLYVVWSTVVDNAVLVGDRAELVQEGFAVEGLDLADATGTSAHSGTGGWSGEDLFVGNATTRSEDSFFWLSRGLLTEYAQLLVADRVQEAESLLVPDLGET